MTGTTFDYIIVGAGTAGCLLANRLSTDRNVRVLLIEAGGPDDYHWVHIPVGMTNSAPLGVLSGQRCMMDFCLV